MSNKIIEAIQTDINDKTEYKILILAELLPYMSKIKPIDCFRYKVKTRLDSIDYDNEKSKIYNELKNYKIGEWKYVSNFQKDMDFCFNTPIDVINTSEQLILFCYNPEANKFGICDAWDNEFNWANMHHNDNISVKKFIDAYIPLISHNIGDKIVSNAEFKTCKNTSAPGYYKNHIQFSHIIDVLDDTLGTIKKYDKHGLLFKQ
jgi:hypothetical protein